jgi:RNA polymerase sigma factor (sigma-70 family)
MNETIDQTGVTGSWIYLVEDDAAVRGSLALLLQLRGFNTSGFGSAEEFLASTSEPERPACALLDVRLPGISGLELQQRMRREGKGMPVVVMTAHGDVATARAALRQGAVDFLEKPVDESELLEAVTLALRSDLEQVELAREREEMLARIQKLTDREFEVFERVTSGRHNREIAEEFGISQRTVEVHRSRLMEKLQARRVADLFRLRFELDERNAALRPAVSGAELARGRA